jgi:NAD(P)-dependent dehydrogenase (short-subunit alcohol dehydrogenase family)
MINSAGVMALPETRVGPGWEGHFAINHLGHFALVDRLAPALAADARVVSVSSAGHQTSGIRWADPHFTAAPYDKWLAYGQSKTANVLFSVALAAAGVRSFAVHPGRILTDLARHVTVEERIANGWIDEAGNVIDPLFKTPEQGAATQVWAATSPRLADRCGLYLEDCDVAEPTDADTMESGVRDHALDPGQAEELWTLSAALTR